MVATGIQCLRCLSAARTKGVDKGSCGQDGESQFSLWQRDDDIVCQLIGWPGSAVKGEGTVCEQGQDSREAHDNFRAGCCQARNRDSR